MDQIQVDGLLIGVSWVDYDPVHWRDHPDPEEGEFEDDEERPTPEDVKSLSGIDPDEEGW